MTTIFTTRLLNVLAVLAPVVLALRRPRRRPDSRRCSVRRCVQWWRWPVSSMAGPTCLSCPSSVGTTERLYVRGGDLVIINSGACALLTPAERLECFDTLSRNIGSPSPPAGHRARTSASGHICTVAYGSVSFDPA